MEQLTIGKRFTLTCPERFRPVTKKERDRFHMPESDDSLGLIREDDRIVASMGWKDVGAFAGILLHVISPAASVEASVSRDMAGYGYRKEKSLRREIGGVKAEGFRYTYTAGDNYMVGESYVTRQGRSLTFFHVYLPDELREQGLLHWNALLDAVQPL